MSDIFVGGAGAVSPAGWSVSALQEAVTRGEPLPTKDLTRPGPKDPLRVRAVPTPNPRPPFISHPRLRRSSPIALHAVSAALEALGPDAAKVSSGELRLGIVLCVMSGCVTYSRRFYDETLRDPGTASPLVFPETVFNAPASHLGALLGTTAINYTLVGDPSTFLQGLALAADWLEGKRVDGCLVIGAEEMDWLVPDAFSLFNGLAVISDGAGAMYLHRMPETQPAVKLDAITHTHIFGQTQTRTAAARRARAEIGAGSAKDLLCDGLQDISRLDRPEELAWQDWPGARISPKKILGEGLMAGTAWQCVLACQALRERHYSAAVVSAVGCNQQAIAARFALPTSTEI